MPSQVENNFTIEEIASIAQKYLTKQPVIVLGTGATIPHNLPSMHDLADIFLKGENQDWDRWGDFIENLSGHKDLEKSLSDIDLSKEAVQHILVKVWELICERDLQFYYSLYKSDFPFPLARLFKYLLATSHCFINVITTNYDRLAEYAANSIKAKVLTGITEGWVQRFHSSLVMEGSTSISKRMLSGYEGIVRVLKVHGSLDWFVNPNDCVCGIPLASSIPEEFSPLIVTPGSSKYEKVQNDPFRTLSSCSDSVLRQAECFLCIGYGFNDEDVQPVLISQVREYDIPIIIVTKKISENARKKFLITPPKKFLFFEEGEKGTNIYFPESPNGINFPVESLWKLNSFMKLILGEKRD